MSWKEINTGLEKMDKKQIISIIKAMYTANKANKTFLSAKLISTSFDKILEEAKQKIENQFFPNRGYGKCNLVVAKKAISDYKTITNDEVGYLDLMLTYVEQGVLFVNEYGDIKENAYDSMQGVFDKFLTHLQKEKDTTLFNNFKDRIEELRISASDIGYGFGDDVSHDIKQLMRFFDKKE
jgi:hypothetical protein